MLIADVNVFLYAHRPESAQHDKHRQWLDDAVHGTEVFGVSEAVLSSFLRITTHHRVYLEPTPPEVAVAFCEAVLRGPAVVRVRPGPEHWHIFTSLLQTSGARGNVVPDAYLAALAMEHGATWITTDRGFARFPGLRWRTPLT